MDIGAETRRQPSPDQIPSRRELLVCGGLAFGAMLLGGCGAKKSARRPDLTFPETPITSMPTVPNPAPGPIARAPVGQSIAVIPRSAWAGQGMVESRPHDAMGRITKITVHHDANRVTGMRTQSEVARRIEGIRRYHVQKNWADIGYHYIVDPMGRVWEGRSTRWQGAHVGGDANKNNLGIVLMGNFDQQSPTSAQLGALDAFVAQQIRNYRISLSYVKTHQEIKPTACPGRSLQSHMNQTRSRGGQIATAFNT